MDKFWQLLLDPPPDQFLMSVLAWLGIGVLTGSLALGLGVWLHRAGMPLLPPQRRRAVPWGGMAIVGAVFFSSLAPALLAPVLVGSPLFERLYGPGFSKELRHSDGSTAQALAVSRLSLWSMVLTFPFVIGFLCGPFAQIVGAAPYQFGWTLHQWRRRLLLGALAWLLVTPFLYAFNVCLSIAYRELLNGPEQQHQLEILAKSGPSELEWLLLIFSAVIVAPVQEELVFRGIMLPWANQSFRNADLMVLWTLPLTLLLRAGRISEALHASPVSWEDLGPELQPPACALLLVVIYFGLRAVWRSPAPAGIYATALIFGFAHALVWPTPVPLFFLGLNLAALAYRTQGLLAPMVLHALFNGVACMTLLLG